MSKMIQIRNVPQATHRALKARAAMQGKSLSDYILDELERLAALPTMEEMMARLKQREPVNLPISPAEVIRQERDSR